MTAPLSPLVPIIDSADSTVRLPVRSFVRRNGRMTGAQSRALGEFWEALGVDYAPAALDLAALFGRTAPCTLEIGFGNGDTLLALATAHPERNFFGIEVHEPGVGRVLLETQHLGLRNIRVSRHDAVEVLRRQISDETFAEILVFFPDPWPKTRHHKRRLIQTPFVELLASKLQAGGILRMATDWQQYAEQMLEVLSHCKTLSNCSPDATFVERPASRPLTRFEQRGRRLGHGVWDLAYIKK